jgi:NAD(P)-dependent dehydrogenase (short-subunit alcohol dehydrogenase family)
MNGEAAAAVGATTGGPGVACDVTDEAAVEAALKTVNDAIGVPRILLNAAGVGTPGLTVGKNGPLPLKEFTRVIDINVNGTFNVLRLAAANMAALEPLDTAERGLIVNVASVAAYDGQRGQAAYGASKGAVAAMTLPLARDLAQHGIRVMTIAPGIFNTPLLQTLPENIQEALANSIPFPKRLGDPDEFAALVCHFAENPSLNGETVRLDGAVRLAG